ncbi:hypothetical protein KCU92_g6042, partial [Aureobasidium melanogenum]
MAAIQGLREQIAANFRLLDECASAEEFEIIVLKEADLYRASIAHKTRLKYLLCMSELSPTVTAALEGLLDLTAEYLGNIPDVYYADCATPPDEVGAVDEGALYNNDGRAREHLYRASVSPASSSSESSSFESSSDGFECPGCIKRESPESSSSSSSGSSSSELSSPGSIAFERPEIIKRESSGSTSVESHSVQPLDRPASRSTTPLATSQASTPRPQAPKRRASAMDDADAEDTNQPNTLRRSTRMRRSLYQS